jgi:hypothetical protein
MGFFDVVLRKKKSLRLEDVKREEIRLGIRENQTLAKLERLEKEREEIFSKGSKIKSPSRRRQLARLYDMKTNGTKMMERELATLSKELTTMSALKLALERKKMSTESASQLLQKVEEAKLTTLLEDDKISQELYQEKLTNVLSVVMENPATLIEDLGKEGNEVMDVWQKMDEGEIESFEDGIKLADRKLREKDRKSELEAE